MDLTGLIQIFTGFLGSLGFSILFNIRGRKLWVASLGGLISWTIFLLLEPVFQGEASGISSRQRQLPCIPRCSPGC